MTPAAGQFPPPFSSVAPPAGNRRIFLEKKSSCFSKISPETCLLFVQGSEQVPRLFSEADPCEQSVPDLEQGAGSFSLSLFHPF